MMLCVCLVGCPRYILFDVLMSIMDAYGYGKVNDAMLLEFKADVRRQMRQQGLLKSSGADEAACAAYMFSMIACGWRSLHNFTHRAVTSRRRAGACREAQQRQPKLNRAGMLLRCAGNLSTATYADLRCHSCRFWCPLLELRHRRWRGCVIADLFTVQDSPLLFQGLPAHALESRTQAGLHAAPDTRAS